VSESLRSPFAPAPWEPGTLVKERYRLEAIMRRGGMGSVWRALDITTNTPLAVKGLEPEVARDRIMVQRFLREAQAARALVSPNVVGIVDYGVDHDQAFIAMELLDGEPLSERIAKLGRLPPDEVYRFVTDVLRAMERAHEAGIVHRDIKPDNVFICRGDPEVAKVLDFGIAKVKKGTFGAGTGTATHTGLMLGTPYYMSPEQAQARAIDQRTDLWSIAVVAFEALLGRRPFQAEFFGDLVVAICTAPTPVPSSVGPVPAGFDEWFVRGTQRDPARRFQSAREMAEELGAVLGPTPLKRVITARSPVVSASLAPGLAGSVPPRGSTRPSGDSHDLHLTTGQRSAVTRSNSASAPTRGGNAGLVALLALGALILIGVAVFAFGGGARALHEAELSTAHAAVVPAARPDERGTATEPNSAPASATPKTATSAPLRTPTAPR
jgi:serine/threonine-protein kinase